MPSTRLLTIASTLGLLVLASSASALPVPISFYDSAGFQDPTRFTSNASLEGQDPLLGPWRITSNANPAQANVRPTVGVGGSQGVEVITAPNQTDTDWYVNKAIVPTAPYDTVKIDWAMNYKPTTVSGLQYGPFFGVEINDFSDAANPKLVGGFGVDSTSGDLLVYLNNGGDTGFFTLDTPAPVHTVAGNAYNNFSITANYTDQTYSVWLNGQLLETDPFVTAAAAFTDADITTRFASNPGEQGLNAGTAYFDNFSIVAVPEPTMISAIAFFSLGLMGRRR